MIVTARTENRQSVSTEKPGECMSQSRRMSLVVRAIRSPMRCRLWKVWLLPSSEMVSSSRACCCIRAPSTSKLYAPSRSVMLPMMAMTPRTIAICTIVVQVPSPPPIRLKAAPTSSGGAILRPAVSRTPPNAASMIQGDRRSCDQIQRHAPERFVSRAPATRNSVAPPRMSGAGGTGTRMASSTVGVCVTTVLTNPVRHHSPAEPDLPVPACPQRPLAERRFTPSTYRRSGHHRNKSPPAASPVGALQDRPRHGPVRPLERQHSHACGHD